MKTATPIRVIPSGKVYRQIFDAETQLVKALTDREKTKEFDLRHGNPLSKSTKKLTDLDGFEMIRTDKQLIPIATIFTNDAPGLLSERGRTWIKGQPNEPAEKHVVSQKKPDELATLSNQANSRLVYALPDIVETSKRGSDIIERVAGRRKSRHDKMVADLHDEFSIISKKIEPKIKEMSKILLSNLSEDQMEIDKLLILTENDYSLIKYTRKELNEFWEVICEHSNKRYQLIESFYAEVQLLEDRRLNDIQKLFRIYSEKLHNICHLMPDDLNKFLELETQEINQSILSNRRCYADVYHQLMVQDLFSEKTRSTEWFNRITRWRDLHINIKVNEFRDYMNSDEVLEPLATKECMSLLIGEQRILNNKHLDLLNTLNIFQPPNSTKNIVYEWNHHVTEIVKQLDELNQSYFNKLYLEYEQVCNNCLGYIEAIVKDLIEREVADTTYTKEIINNECLPLIGMRQTSFENLLETMDRRLEKHNGQILEEMRNLFKYCQGAAHLWDTHELGLTKQERILHEKLDSCRLQHDNLNQVLENELDIVMDKMRQEASERDLDFQLEKSLVMLEQIKDGYDEFHNSQVSIVNEYPTMVREELKRYDKSLCSYFEVDRVTDAQKIESKTKSKSLKTIDGSISMIDQSKSLTKTTKKVESVIEEALPRAVVDILSTKNGTNFYIQSKATTSATATTSGENEQQPPDSGDIGEGQALPIYLASINIEVTFIDEIKKKICVNFLNHLEDWTNQGVSRANGLTLTKIEELNSELDLRIHLHKPRSSRAQLDVHHVRAAELVMHGERVSRHVQGGKQTLTELRRDFTKMQTSHGELTVKLRQDIEALQNIFLNATKSSKLVSLSNQLQHLKERFMQAIRSSLRIFRQKLDDTLQMLRTSNAFFIKSFKVFSDGGNFCPEEIETYKSRLETIAIKVDKCEGTVMSDLEGIEAKRLELATKIVAEFEERFKHHMVDLHFMEKISRWLTNTQVKIKAEVAASNMAAKDCSVLLHDLEMRIRYCRTRNCCPPDQPKVSPAELYSGLINSFKMFYERAIYLNALQSMKTLAPENIPNSIENITSQKVLLETSTSKNTKVSSEDPTVSVIKNILKTQKNKSATSGGEIDDISEQILCQLGPNINLLAQAGQAPPSQRVPGVVTTAGGVTGTVNQTSAEKGSRSADVVSRSSQNDRSASAGCSSQMSMFSANSLAVVNNNQLLPQRKSKIINMDRRGSKIDRKYFVFGDTALLQEQPALLQSEQIHFLGKITKILRITLDGLLTASEIYYKLKRERPVTRPQVLQENFDLCAATIVSKLQSYFIQADQYHNKCILELREQVLSMETMMATVPDLIIENLLDNVIAKMKECDQRITNDSKQDFQKFSDDKKAHNKLLRPVLGHPQRNDELKKLCNEEEQRVLKFADLIDELFCNQQNQIVENGEVFIENLTELVNEAFQSFDTFTTIDDLVRARCSNAKYPVSELLRRQKHGEQLEDAIDKGQLPRGPKTWPGLPKSELTLPYGLPSNQTLTDLNPDFVTYAETSSDETEIKVVDSRSSIQLRSSLKTKTKKKTKQESTPNIFTNKTTLAHTQLLQSRDAAYKKFKEFFENCLTENEANREKKLDAEKRWIENWRSSAINVKSLYK